MKDESKRSSMTDETETSSIQSEPEAKSSSTSSRRGSRTRKNSTEKAITAGIAMKYMDPADIIAILEMHADVGNIEHAMSCFQSLKKSKRSSALSAA